MGGVTSPLRELARRFGSSIPSVTQASNATRRLAFLPLRRNIGNGRGGILVLPSHGRAISMAHRCVNRAQPSRAAVFTQSRTFHATSPASARLDPSTIEYAMMPTTADLFPPPSTEPFVHLRVPLAPDNYAPQRLHEPEAPFVPSTPEIVVMAAHPENVAPAALTEVEGMGPDGVELNFAHDVHAAADAAEEREPGMVKDLWKGLLDDVFGEKKSAA